MPAPSKSQVRKAGSTLRAFTQGKVSEQERLAALEVIAEYRRTFADPLLKVNNGLRSFFATEGIEAEVSQRLKRMETIVEKLTYREKGLDLSRMGDIGGCRIVISDNNIPNIYRIRERIEYRWGKQIVRESDYINHPRASGYRAVHVIVKRDERLIEVQLRTQRMHEWAQLVESLSQMTGLNYKQDVGESAVQEFGKCLSKVHQHMDGRYELVDEDVKEFSYWRSRVLAMLGGGQLEQEEH